VPDPDLRRALRFIAPHSRRLALVLVLSLLSTALSLYVPLLSRDFVDGALLGRDLSRLVRVVLLFALFTLAAFVVNSVSGLRYTRVSADILFDMRLEMYRHLQRLSPRFYARTRLGDIMSRINNDIGEIQRIAAETALALLGNTLFLLGTVVMLAWLDLRLFVIAAGSVPFGLWALARYRKRLEGAVAALRQRSADIGSFLIETIQAAKLVVLAGAEEREVARFRARNDAFVRSLMSMQLLTYLSGGLPGLIFSAGAGAVFLYGGWRIVRGTMTMGTFVAFMAYQMRLLPPLQALMTMYANLATVRVSLNRVSQILDEPIEVVERADARGLQTVHGAIAFEDVTLTFNRGAPVLEHVSFTIAPGEVVAIVGSSGSGKSTIADLLLRLLDPDSGGIFLDGHNLRELGLADLRRHIALVDQEPTILHATIGENIRYARPAASDREVIDAARKAALDRFVDSLPQRYETVVGERGMALSAGERQRIATARAFLMDPAVLILDEPTAALDPMTERRLVDGYEDVMRGRTTIVITHRREVARRADRIIAVEGGRTIEEAESAARRSEPRGV
jgi:ATP-binding cassette subfamily B protein